MAFAARLIVGSSIFILLLNHIEAVKAAPTIQLLTGSSEKDNHQTVRHPYREDQTLSKVLSANRTATSSWEIFLDDNKCADLREGCEAWASNGRCESDKRYMFPHCPVSCGVCANRTRNVPLEDAFSMDPTRLQGQVVSSAIGGDIGVPQVITRDISIDTVEQVLDSARRYLASIQLHPRYEKVHAICRNRSPYCALWATQGKCYRDDTDFNIQIDCAPICLTCEQLHLEARCPIDPNVKNAWYPGDIDRMFENLVSNATFSRYEPQILSRPNPDGVGEDFESSEAPWVVVLDNFLSNDETGRLIELGDELGYKLSSEGTATSQTDGSWQIIESRRRTSYNTWCFDECYRDEHVGTIQERIELITGIPIENAEPLQLLRYEEGQYYKEHHDYAPQLLTRSCGVRILTVFLYLNDVEEGGGTNFPILNVTVQPKRGRVVLWPNVYNDDPHRDDRMTRHQALPVVKGVKYGANAWYHQRNYRDAFAARCI